ncbi:MAG TPA: transcription termination factor NusA [bacterium]|nr:transcription termination factor NusA [bacterium]
MTSDFLLAIRQIERERELPPELIQEIVEDALVKAYQQESEGLQSIRVEFDVDSGRLNIYRVREVVEEVRNPALEISLEDAQRVNDEVEVGELVETAATLRNFRRIGIQTVKQLIVQRVRDMERNMQLDRFADKETQIITGIVSRITSNGIIVSFDRIDGLLPREERIPGEKPSIGRRLKVLVKEVRRGTKDNEIILSRSDPEFVKKLFSIEVPEIAQGIVQVKEIVREAGYRTKMAVVSTQEKVDPVGACVGYKGSRVKNIVNELNGEKIDIIPWSDEPAQFIAHALSPAQVISVEIFDDHSAEVIVPDNQLSLAIGKQGQNARLANKLTTWKIDILSDTEKERLTQELRVSDLLSKPLEGIGLSTRTSNLLAEAGLKYIYDLAKMTEGEVTGLPGIGDKSLEEIKEKMKENGVKLLEEGHAPPQAPESITAERKETPQAAEEASDVEGTSDAEGEAAVEEEATGVEGASDTEEVSAEEGEAAVEED